MKTFSFLQNNLEFNNYNYSRPPTFKSQRYIERLAVQPKIIARKKISSIIQSFLKDRVLNIPTQYLSK